MDDDLAIDYAYFVHGVLSYYNGDAWKEGQIELVSKLLPYAEILNRQANRVLREVKSFEGIFAYEIAETEAPRIFWNYVAAHGKLPTTRMWTTKMHKAVLAWAKA